MPDNDDFEYDMSEGERSLRAQLKKLNEAHKVQQAEFEAREAELAQIRSEQRRSQVAQVLEAAGLPSNPARLYPSDGDVSEEAVLSWAQENLGVSAGTQRTQTPQSEERLSTFDRYQEMISGSVGGGAQGEQSILDLRDSMLADVRNALGPISARKVHKPTAEEWADARQKAARVSDLNRRLERDVRSGRIQMPEASFGGLMRPPPWADRTQEAS